MSAEQKARFPGIVIGHKSYFQLIIAVLRVLRMVTHIRWMEMPKIPSLLGI